MAKITKKHREASKEAQRRLQGNPSVVSVGIGFKYRGGVRTDEVCVVVGVKKKLPEDQIPEGQAVMSSVNDVPTDVVEYGELKAHQTTQTLTQKRRPCPPGYSIGHPLVTAGTLGAWVKRGDDESSYILSNNHVIANSNDTLIGEFIRQPGRADGGTDSDRLARLTDYVRIRFDSEDGDGKKSNASFAWRAWKWPANLLARWIGCPYRLVVARPNQIGQPYPNLVDAGIAQVINEGWVDLAVPEIGPIEGIRDLQLGDKVQKTGRTTEHTTGMVEVVDSSSVVDYGPGKGNATFQDQVVIRSEDGGEFSAGGDSGSAIVTEDGFLGGLLFAGGVGVTIANRVSHVVSLLGVRL